MGMPTQPAFHNGGFYHLYNRGVEKRIIFIDPSDHFHFIHDLFEFNDADAVLNTTFYRNQLNYRGLTSIVERKPRKLLVDILAYALMPNHFHLLVKQRRDSGVSLFMQKLGTGYTGYFNIKRKRSGVLFQGTYKAKPIHEDRYLRHLVMYIHGNPADLFIDQERSRSIISQSVANQLGDYRWSSYLDYLGKKNFPSVLNFGLIRDLGLSIGDRHGIELRTWFKDKEHNEEKIVDSIFRERSTIEV